jgi:hypothetical protein
VGPRAGLDAEVRQSPGVLARAVLCSGSDMCDATEPDRTFTWRGTVRLDSDVGA